MTGTTKDPAVPTSPWNRDRLLFIALALGSIALGLLVQRRGAILSPTARDVLGDGIWALMMTWWMGAMMPRAAAWRRGLAALAVCGGVEFSQLYHASALDAARRTAPGHLVLGSDFDPRDLGAYASGVLAAVLLEAAFRRRRQAGARMEANR
ncbi:MAG: ribosomal maturation YjgA family protein [Gemmatimonadaceae bacterium]